MGRSEKQKGYRFEREIVLAARDAGLRVERADGSNGTRLVTDAGMRCTSDVDLLIEGRLRIQAKRRKSIAHYLKPPVGAHMTVVREDRGEAVAVVPLKLLLRLLAKVYNVAGEGERQIRSMETTE